MKIRGQEVYAPEQRISKSSLLDEATGCWNWTASVIPGPRPYGRLTIGSRTLGTRRTVSAHRFSYETFTGPIGSSNLCVCHRCDNPRCVNPAHLFLGTKKDNADDRDAKGRNIPAPIISGESHTFAKLTDRQIEYIRSHSASSLVVAKELGIDDSYVRAIRRGERRKTPAPVSA